MPLQPRLWADREVLLKAIREDHQAHPEAYRKDASGTMTIAFTRQPQRRGNSLLDALVSGVSTYWSDSNDSCVIYPDDEHFQEALRQVGILNSDGTYNENNRYAK